MYPKIRKDTTHIQKFSYAKRTLPAFICTNPHLYILPETRASSPNVPSRRPHRRAEQKNAAKKKAYAWVYE